MLLKPRRRPTPPGIILQEHYLDPRGITITELAEAINCSRKHISNIVHGHARIEADLATRLAAALDTTPQFWLNLQNALDIYEAQQKYKHWKPEKVFQAHPQ